MTMALAVGMASVASAALITGNHNVILHEPLGSGASQQGPCSFCHTPHGAAGDKLFPTSVTIASSSQWTNDGIAQICWSCHGVNTYNDTQEVNPFQADTVGVHGRAISRLVTWGDISAPGDLASIYGYTDSAARAVADGGQYAIGCDSCHNPHDNAIRPFMRDNSAGTALVAGDFNTLCDDCHVNRAALASMDQGAGTRVNHPSPVSMNADSAAANLYDYGGLGGYSPFINSTWASLAIENSGGTAQHWNLGGKFQYEAAITGIVNCGTCHAVHQNEATEVGFAADDGLAGGLVSSAINWGYDSLLVRNSNPTAGAVAAICTACHDITDAAAGPGLPASESHAFQSNAWWSTTTITDTRPGSANDRGSKFGGTWGDSTATIVCQSCHDMHFAARPDTASVDYSLMRNECDDCHGPTTLANHHPSGVAVTFGTDIRDDGGGAPRVGSDVIWDGLTRAEINTPDYTDWTPTTEVYSFGTGNVMTCATCHSGSGDGAHNNTSFPGLAGVATDSVMCVDCHGFNPSLFTRIGAAATSGIDYAGNGSHYLGTMNNVTYAWGEGTGARDSVTPAAGPGSAQYGSDSGASMELICTSCHLIRTVTTFTPSASDNTGDNEGSTEDAIGLLLSPAGNNITDAATANDFLCTACHGSTPGGGGTHPVQPTVAAAMSGTVGNNASAAGNGVSHIGNNTGISTGGINCESCHRPHNANTAASTLILEYVDASGGYINQQALCNLCHVQ